MARELVITITGETEIARAQLRALESQIRELSTSFQKGYFGSGQAAEDYFKKQLTPLVEKQIELKGQLRELDAANKQAADSTKKLGSEVQKTSTATDQLVSVVKRYIGPAAIGMAIKSTIDWAGALQDLSGRTGLSTEALRGPRPSFCFRMIKSILE